MVEDLTKEILPIEENQNGGGTKKLLYKNWKIYATALGIITVALAVSLGVGLGVQNSSQNTVSTTQKIVNEINNSTTSYTLLSTAGVTTVQSITDQINSDFIKTKLTSNNTAFNAELFTLISITVSEDNHVLASNDISSVGIINAKINYSYDTINDQSTNLTITVTAPTTGIRSVIKVTELGTLNSNESAVILIALGKANNFDPFFNDWMFEVTDNTSNSATVISFAFPNESVEVTFKVIIPLFQDLGKIQIPEETKTITDFMVHFMDEGYKSVVELITSLSDIWDSLDNDSFYFQFVGYETVKDSNQIVWLTEEDLDNDYPINVNQRLVLTFVYDEELDEPKDSVQHEKFHLEVAVDIVYGDSYQILKTSNGILS